MSPIRIEIAKITVQKVCPPTANRVRIQMAGISNRADALAAIDAGADALGFTLRLPTGPHNGLDDAKAKSIIQKLPPFVSKVVITYLGRARDAVELVRFLGVQAIQFHGPTKAAEVAAFRREMPAIRIIRSVIVRDRSAIQEARKWQGKADALITDTFDPDTGRIGATGKTHDWSISRSIVEAVSVPVILAGGLNPDNVADAIRQVRPWGVDVHTGVENADGSFAPGKARAFVKAVELACRE